VPGIVGLVAGLAILLFVSVCPVMAAERMVAESADELYQRAVQSAHDGNTADAAELAAAALRLAPDYVDVEVLLGRLAAWEHDYEGARSHLDRALSLDPNYVDALAARSDIEFWAGDTEAALAFCDHALRIAPDDDELLGRRRRLAAALAVAQAPKRRAGKRVDVVAGAAGDAPTNRLAVSYMNETFDRDFADWHESVVSLEHEGERGPLIGRVTHFNRFGDDALLFEVDAYPDLREGTYAFLSVGRSSDSIVAKSRWAAEIFQALPGAFEASLGYRAQKFDSTATTLRCGPTAPRYPARRPRPGPSRRGDTSKTKRSTSH
jgi:tetratricopeptide (TPR) repeat protein